MEKPQQETHPEQAAEAHRNAARKAEMARRWRLILGNSGEEAFGRLEDPSDLQVDKTLAALYDKQNIKGYRGPTAKDYTEEAMRKKGRGGGQKSSPGLVRWLKDIRQNFSRNTVRMLQSDAINRLEIKELLAEPEVLDELSPDVELAAELIALSDAMSDNAKAAARQVIRKLVEEVLARLKFATEQAIRGSLRQQQPRRQATATNLHLHKTVQRNLRNWQPEQQAIVVEELYGLPRKRQSLKQIVLVVDQSGSMATSVVYAGILASVLAGLPSLKTNLVLFDTEVVDVSHKLDDPVELLMGVQLGGGTNIGKAVKYAASLVEQPRQTHFILLSDFYEGPEPVAMFQQLGQLMELGANCIGLLALNDEGIPVYHQQVTHKLSQMGMPSVGCVPSAFPSLIAGLLNRKSIAHWARQNDQYLAQG